MESLNHIDPSFSINPYSFFAKPSLDHSSAGSTIDTLKMMQSQIDQIQAINNQILQYSDSIQSVNISPRELSSQMQQLMEDFLNLDDETRAKLAGKLAKTREKVHKFLKSRTAHSLKKAHKSVKKLRAKTKKKLQNGHARVNSANSPSVKTIHTLMNSGDGGRSLSRTPVAQLTKAGLGLGI